MQLLENSVIGLRSARHIFRRATGEGGREGARVTLFPMVHVGDRAFYDTVIDDASAHDFVLTEGIDTPVVRRLTTAYRWLNFDRLGLMLQPKKAFDGFGAKAIRADLSAAEFNALWREAPVALRLAAQVVFPAFGLWQRFTATRGSLARALSQDDLSARDEIMAWTPRSAPFHHALLTARDARLRRDLRHVLRGTPAPRSVAVVFGAAHMPSLLPVLREEGFALDESTWMPVIAL